MIIFAKYYLKTNLGNHEECIAIYNNDIKPLSDQKLKAVLKYKSLNPELVFNTQE